MGALALTCVVAGVRFQRMLVVPLIFMVIWNFAGAMALIPVVGQEKTIQYTGTSVYLAIAAIVFACLFSSSDEYESALISERRAQGRYNHRRSRWPIVTFVGCSLVVAGSVLLLN